MPRSNRILSSRYAVGIARNALVGAAAVLTAGILACSGNDSGPPNAEFLVTTADSAFWVRSGSQGIHVKAVPMTLAHFDGHFHEVFIVDLDRSFDDAIFTGERVYVRDLQTNDSTLVYDDTAIVTIAAHHARSFPDAVPLGPNDDTPTNPDITASGETDILEVRGPYALIEHRVEYEMPAGDQHDTVRTAVDLRTGAAATPEEMARDSASEDSNLVRTVPRVWKRTGYSLDVSGQADGSVLLSLRDSDRHAWQLFSVGAHPRVYWLDQPPVSAASRRALMRAFNSASSYDETVKYVRFVRPASRSVVNHRARHA
ncbi:MAG: hypothetical protein ABI035_10080 [Gemmatimonadaceae bacterium]